MFRFIVIFVLLLGTMELFAQQWYLSPVYHGRDMYSVSVLDRADIVAGGGNEQNDSIEDVFVSRSGGLDWAFSHNEGGAHIRSTDFTDSLNGLAVGYGGKILKTSNGAVSWNRIYPPGVMTQRNFIKVLYKDAQTAFAVGGRNYGNDTVQSIIRSTDGGSTWNSVHDQPGRWLKGLYFIDASTGIAVGGKGTILKTTDGGNNWAPVNSPVYNRDLNAVYFSNSTTGYIVGGTYVGFDSLASARTILKTTDGGDSWTVITDEAGGWLTDIEFIDQNTGYITGDIATLYKTGNGGSNWIEQTVTGSSWYSHFTSVDFLNLDYGVVGALYGEVYLYSNEALPDVVTLPAVITSVTDTSAAANLRATINAHGRPVLKNFKYSTTPDFSANVGFAHFQIYPAPFNSYTPSLVEDPVNNLMPDTVYYFFAMATAINGVAYGDTLSFNTRLFYTEFITSMATSVTSNSAVLNGEVNGFTAAVNLYFQYGTTPAFGNQVSASPFVITDDQEHGVTASLQGLTNNIYYYRLMGVSGSDTIYSNVSTLLIGPLFQAIQTLPASAVTETGATLNGYLSGLVTAGTISFEYGTTNTLGTETPAVPSTITDNQPYNVSLQLNGLQTGTTYYYRLKVVTALGEFYGDILTFIPAFDNSILETGPANHVTSTSARLNAVLSNISLPVNVFFEYGITPALGSSIAANPSSINDVQYHGVYADINNLQPGAIYYYRLKCVFANFNLYGDIRQVFTAEPEIPNWDFQEWETNTTEIPEEWIIASENFAKVPGVSGSALKLTKKCLTLLGMLGAAEGDNIAAYGGCPLNARPDSLVFQADYYMDPSDTAIILIISKYNGNVISGDFYPLLGSSNGFERQAFAMHYQTADIPDSIVLAFISFNMMTRNYAGDYVNNYLILDDIGFSPPLNIGCNTDFEDWFTYDHLDLKDWFYKKYVDIDPLDVPASSFVIQQEYLPGEYAAEARNRIVKGRYLGTDVSTYPNKVEDDALYPSFDVNKRFLHLNGYYKFTPFANDTALIQVFMFKDGERVGAGSLSQASTVSELTPFDILITYVNDTVIPDSAIVLFQSFKGIAFGPSSIWVDKISFDGFWGTDGGIFVSLPQQNSGNFNIYPNPAGNNVTIEFTEVVNKKAFIQLLDINGKTVNEFYVSPGQSKAIIDVSGYHEGIYFVRSVSDDRLFNRKLVIIK